MNAELRQQYQWLQVLVYHLQLPEWLLGEKIDREDAQALVANFAPDLGVDPEDPKFLSKVALVLHRLLTEQEGPSIPTNLEDSLRYHQEHLKETRRAALKKTFPSLDEQIRTLQRQYSLKIRAELEKDNEELRKNPRLAEEISQNASLRIILRLPTTLVKKPLKEVVSSDEYQQIIREVIKEELGRISQSPSETTIQNIAATSQEEAEQLVVIPHKDTSIEKLPAKPKPPEPKSVPTAEISQKPPAPIKLTDRPYLKLRKQPERAASPIKQTQALVKKAALVPLVKPIQGLVHAAPEKWRQEHPTLVLVATGITPKIIEDTLEHLTRKDPKSPEISYWRSLKAAYEKEKPPLVPLFEHYYQWDQLGKVATKVETLKTNFLARAISFGRSKTFVDLKLFFWKKLKSSGIGKFIGRSAQKVLIFTSRLPEYFKQTFFPGLSQMAPTGREETTKVITTTKVGPLLGFPRRISILPKGIAGLIKGQITRTTFGGMIMAKRSFAGVGTTIGRFTTKITTLFAQLSKVSPETSVVFAIIGVFLGMMMITVLLTTNTTGGAFMLPAGPVEEEEETPPPIVPPEISPPPELEFRWPVNSPFYCSSNYGYRELTLENGQKTCDYHEGIDIPASWRAPVYATAKGEVYATGSDNGYGIYVVVKHDNNFYSIYAHLLAISVSQGENVNHSSVLGYVDDTGRSYGTHLHFGFSTCGEVPGCFSRNTPGSQTPDPCDYLSQINPACSASCGYRDEKSGCPSL